MSFKDKAPEIIRIFRCYVSGKNDIQSCMKKLACATHLEKVPVHAVLKLLSFLCQSSLVYIIRKAFKCIIIKITFRCQHIFFFLRLWHLPYPGVCLSHIILINFNRFITFRFPVELGLLDKSHIAVFLLKSFLSMTEIETWLFDSPQSFSLIILLVLSGF